MKIRVLFILGIVVLIITGINLVRFLEHTGKQRRFLEQPAKPEAPYSDQARDDDVRSGAPAHIPTNAGAAVKARLLTPEEQAILDQAEATGADEETLEEIRTNIEPISQMVKVFSYPIEFYGKVVDENGEPVGGATATYSTFSKMFEDSEKLSVQSASNGLFSINTQGGSIYVNVSKPGYYQTEQSGGSFGYAVPSTYPPADQPDEPAIFYLRKKGEAEPLIHISRKPFRLPRTGQPVEVSLKTGEIVPSGKGDLEVRIWAGDAVDDVRGSSDQLEWRFALRVPDGGLVERQGEFDFIAPEKGYKQELNSKSLSLAKEATLKNFQFFIKNGDGNFILIDGTIYKRDGLNFYVESFLNPTGSRNLEYDPRKEIRVR